MGPLFWILSVVALLLAILFRVILNDFRYYRGNARKDFVDYIKHHHPDIEILAEGPRAISLKLSSGQQLDFRPQLLYYELSKIDLKDSVAKQKLYNHLISQ